MDWKLAIHLFMPRRLPSTPDNDSDPLLVQWFLDFLKEIKNEDWAFLTRSLEIWADKSVTLRSILQEKRDNDVLYPFYLPTQNSLLILQSSNCIPNTTIVYGIDIHYNAECHRG